MDFAILVLRDCPHVRHIRHHPSPAIRVTASPVLDSSAAVPPPLLPAKAVGPALFIIYYSLFIIHYSLFIIHYPLNH
jgi:hypothetical protein